MNALCSWVCPFEFFGKVTCFISINKSSVLLTFSRKNITFAPLLGKNPEEEKAT